MSLSFNPKTVCVLVADDQPQIRKAIIKVLRKIGIISILEVSDGKEALEKLHEYNIDLIISDLHMNEVDGFEVLKFVRRRDLYSDIPFLLLSSDSAKEDIIKAVDLGVSDYLVKPFKLIDAEKKIINILNKYFDPPTFVKLIRTAEKHILDKNYKEAITLVQQVLQNDPKNSHAIYLKALILAKLEKFDKSVELLQQNIAYNEHFYKNYALLAEIYLKQENTIAAINALKKELELNYKQPDKHLQIAKLLLDLGDIENAIIHFREALKENPKHEKALLGIAQAYAECGNLDKAIYYCKRIRRYYPSNTEALRSLIRFCEQAQQLQKAEFTLKDERKQFPNHCDVYIFLAIIYLKYNDTTQALQALDDLLKIAPKNLDALKMKAKIYQQVHDINSAIQTYKYILSYTIDSQILEEYTNLLIKVKAFKEALFNLYNLLKLDKYYSVQRLSQIAFCYINLNKFIKAYLIFAILEQNTSLTSQQQQYYIMCKNKIFLQRVQLQSPSSSYWRKKLAHNG